MRSHVCDDKDLRAAARRDMSASLTLASCSALESKGPLGRQAAKALLGPRSFLERTTRSLGSYLLSAVAAAGMDLHMGASIRA